MWIDYFFPNRCLHCQIVIGGDEVVCESCMDQISFTHFEYTKMNILKERCCTLFPVENAFALMTFEKQGLSRSIIHELKYRGREKIGKTMAKWMFNALDFKNEAPDLLIPIPLHPKKMRTRGYNQLHSFTQEFSSLTGIPYDFEILKRKNHGKAQALKNKKDRLKTNLDFSMQKTLAGKHFLLVDDVVTTGNTLSRAAWELLNGGQNKVSVVVMAYDF